MLFPKSLTLLVWAMFKKKKGQGTLIIVRRGGPRRTNEWMVKTRLHKKGFEKDLGGGGVQIINILDEWKEMGSEPPEIVRPHHSWSLEAGGGPSRRTEVQYSRELLGNKLKKRGRNGEGRFQRSLKSMVS